jgi:hypothetical protein
MKKYKSANGKLVDIDGLRLANEDTIAVGNMRVNARGDELGAGGKVVKTRNEKMNENYKLHTMVPKDDVVHTDAISAEISAGKRYSRVQEVREIVKRRGSQPEADEVVPEPKDTAVHVDPKDVVDEEDRTTARKIDFESLQQAQNPVVPKRSRGKLADTVASTKPVQENTSSVPVKTIKRI